MAHDFADFSLSDGDVLRRVMTKERHPLRMKELEELFFTKTQRLGYTKKESETVWARIKSFSSFGFNKAHAVTYGTLAYLSAYQKFYEPQEFFCRVINNKGGYYPSYAYINEARRWGITILPPDVQRSESGFSVLGHSIMTGLHEIKNLSSQTIKRIIKRRPFTCAEDFFYSVRPSIDEGMSLIKSGSLDTFGSSWPQLYLMLLLLKSSGNRTSELYESIPKFQDFGLMKKRYEQLHTLDFIPEHHVLELFYPSRNIKIADIQPDGNTPVIGTPIARRVVLTKNKKLMSFVTIDDETSTLEIVLFPKKYSRKALGPVMFVQGAFQDETLVAETCTGLPITDTCQSNTET
jgi:DNA polymerase III alpha subunit